MPPSPEVPLSFSMTIKNVQNSPLRPSKIERIILKMQSFI
jgi:hypothetical protein